jgi:hypothetical protein
MNYVFCSRVAQTVFPNAAFFVGKSIYRVAVLFFVLPGAGI